MLAHIAEILRWPFETRRRAVLVLIFLIAWPHLIEGAVRVSHWHLRHFNG